MSLTQNRIKIISHTMAGNNLLEPIVAVIWSWPLSHAVPFRNWDIVNLRFAHGYWAEEREGNPNCSPLNNDQNNHGMQDRKKQNTCCKSIHRSKFHADGRYKSGPARKPAAAGFLPIYDHSDRALARAILARYVSFIRSGLRFWDSRWSLRTIVKSVWTSYWNYWTP